MVQGVNHVSTWLETTSVTAVKEENREEHERKGISGSEAYRKVRLLMLSLHRQIPTPAGGGAEAACGFRTQKRPVYAHRREAGKELHKLALCTG